MGFDRFIMKLSPFTDDIFKCIAITEYRFISIQISLTFVRKGPVDNMPALG